MITRQLLWTLALLGCALSSQAVTLDKNFAGNPNFKDTVLPGTTAVARPELSGTVLEDQMQSITFAGLSFTIQNRVVRETTSGTLDFYWRIRDISPSGATTSPPGALSAFRLGNFGYASIVDADWRSDSDGTVGPSSARVFNPLMNPSGDINFLFGPTTVGLSDESTFFFLHTDATSYARTAVYDLLADAQLSGPFMTFAPAVPELQTWLLMAGGLLALGWIKRRQS